MVRELNNGRVSHGSQHRYSKLIPRHVKDVSYARLSFTPSDFVSDPWPYMLTTRLMSRRYMVSREAEELWH